MSSIMAFVAEWFDIIRWIGAAYLIWLGVSRLRAVMRSQGVQPATLPIRRGRWFLQGVVASLSNPKVLLFLGAFFPQFIDLSAPVAPQLALLAVSFVVTLAMVDCVVVIAFGSAKGRLVGGRLRIAEGVSGVLLVVGGLWLATARRA
jgi:threonine/homoserine/homoserine lactone efflux protein